MAFLEDDDFQEIRDVLNETIETFTKKTVFYELSPSETVSRFGRDNHNADNSTRYELLGLVVWNAPDSEITVETLGKFDFSMGYVLFGWDYLLSQGLVETIDNNGTPERNVVFIPEKDFITIEGEKLQVMGVNLAGQLNATEVVVKVFFKRDLK